MNIDLDTIFGVLFFVFFVVVPLFTGSRRRGKGAGQGAPATGRRTAPDGRDADSGQGRMSGGQSARSPGGATASTGAPQPSAQGDRPQLTLAEIRRRVEEAQREEEERRAGRRGAATPRGRSHGGTLVSSDPFEGSLVSSEERRLADIGRRSVQERAPASASTSASGGYVIGPEGSTTSPFPGGGFVLGREGTGIPSSPSPRPAQQTSRGQLPAGAGKGTARSTPTGTGQLLGREGAPRREPRSPTEAAPRTAGARRLARAAAAEIGATARRDGARPGERGTGATLAGAGPMRFDKDGVLGGLIWHEVLSPPRSLRHWRRR